VVEDEPEKEGNLKGCSFSEDGVCKLHGVEVERRVKSVAIQNWLLGWSVLVMVFVGGAYIYTREVKNDINIRHAYDTNSANTSIKELAKQVEALMNGQTRTEERYESLLRAITDMNANISALMYLQFEKADAKSKGK